MQKSLYTFSMLSLVATCILMLWIAYVSVVKSNDFYTTAPLVLGLDEIERGQLLPVYFAYCSGGRNARVEYRLIDGQVIFLAQNETVEKKGCAEQMRHIEIPKTIMRGAYALRIVVMYDRSIFKTEKYEYTTEYFTVK